MSRDETDDNSIVLVHLVFVLSFLQDDSGAEGAFVAWMFLGFFPVAGTSVYLLATPLLPAFEITSQITGNVAKLTTENWDGAKENK